MIEKPMSNNLDFLKGKKPINDRLFSWSKERQKVKRAYIDKKLTYEEQDKILKRMETFEKYDKGDRSATVVKKMQEFAREYSMVLKEDGSFNSPGNDINKLRNDFLENIDARINNPEKASVGKGGRNTRDQVFGKAASEKRKNQRDER
ncbi:MAG: hypothetical protein PHI90_08165 [Clostridia bacterium]|nr:hypothetical protein [Clostridia bacterium]MDD4048774.1 hypothetical protein [Clostridia bacterium]